MKFFSFCLAGVSVFFILENCRVAAAEVFNREPWMSSRIKGQPDPPKPFIPEPVFENVTFENGLELVSRDGLLFVVERAGKIWSFPENSPQPEKQLFLDLKALHPKVKWAYGLVFHPKWEENGEFFVTYVYKDQKNGSVLSRFRTEQTTGENENEPPRVDLSSEEVIFTWPSGGHNGANIQFGPDGMLYLSTGDGTGPNPPDILNTGQDTSDYLSSILRIDVDRRDGEKKYHVPVDNPFVGKKNVRPEIWAFGFRNPWKMSFDRSGRLWVGDVGWQLWEMIFLAERGGNYGWSVTEASNPVKPETASDLAPISSPVAAHPHSEAASITGGYVYQGSSLPDLRGAYIYGDYETGIIWALRHDGKKITDHRIIADTPHRISTFGLGNHGELYYIHYGTPAKIYRLNPSPRAGQPSDFPRKLSASGLFRDVAAQDPAPGVYQYNIHEAMWEDGAKATRLVAFPGESGIKTVFNYRSDGSYQATTKWPDDAVLARTVELGERPVETQILHFNGNDWNAYSYQWNEEGTDAELVGAEATEIDVDKTQWKGGSRYRIASRAECMRCHSMWNQFTPGFEPMQLAGFGRFPRKSAREIALGLQLANSEFFQKDEGKGQLVNSRGRGSREARARSWLHANCSHCHRRNGGGSAPLEVNFDRPLSESLTLWERPTRGDFGMSDARIIVPGEPWRSVLNYRIGAIGNGHMPPVGSREVDEHGARLIWDWVRNLPIEKKVEDPKLTGFDDISDSVSAMQLAGAVAAGSLVKKDKSTVVGTGLGSTNINIKSLFERFRSPDDRPAPRNLDRNRILLLKGDPEKGGKLLSKTGKLASCFACHQVGQAGGGLLGPDLTEVGKRLNRAQLIESLTDPSKTIAPEFRLWIVETKSGETYSGFFTEQSEAGVTVKLATGQTEKIASSEIKSTTPQTVSLMPKGLLNLVSEQEAADLIAYLETLQ